ncbi:type II toxin-antitoxin system Phd/YefM family antitoxin [candidate division KSB1 bacterium]|nr:type II toxin-antitoxin system Phd/YefM family antitoxin [candidate division KSB1 bacterium]
MTQVNVHEAKTNLSKLIKKATNGDVVIIARGNKPLVKLVPVNKGQSRKIGTAKGQIWYADDFNEPLEDFKEYME